LAILLHETPNPLSLELRVRNSCVDFIQGLLKENENKLIRSFNFTSRYIDDVLSLNNSRFGDFVDVYTPYAGAAGMLLHINGKFTMGKFKSSLLDCYGISASQITMDMFHLS
jgi:hypothetical protein